MVQLTSPYLAPEVIRGNPYTEKADIYSLGMLTWEILTGKLPFSDCSHDTYLASKICNGERPPIPPEMPDFFKEFICKCWHADPLQRVSAKELHLAIDEFSNISDELAELQDSRLDEIEMMPKFASFSRPDLHPDAVYTSRCFTAEELSANAGTVQSCF